MSLSCEFGACGGGLGFRGGASQPQQTIRFSKDLLFTLVGIGNDLRHLGSGAPPYRLFGTKWCGPGGRGSFGGHINGGCFIHDKCFDRAKISFLVNFGLARMTPEQVQKAKACNEDLYDTATRYPTEAGSQSLQWWLTNGDKYGILAPGTAVTPTQ
jgi:hypothetical protein